MVSVVELRKTSLQDVPGQLRNMADRIERGEYGEVVSLAWIVHNGEKPLPIGLFGASANPAAEGHLLFAIGMRQLEDVG